MKKFLINRKPLYNQAWGGGNLFVKAISENAASFGYEVVYGLQADLDAILMVDPRADEMNIGVHDIYNYKINNPKCKIIHRINECDARKGTDYMDVLLENCSKFTDSTIFVSSWMQEYFSNVWKTKNQYVVKNGVNKEHFQPNQKIKNGKVNIVTHHWSNNPMKGFDIYEKLDDIVGDEFSFTYIGRDRGTFKNTSNPGILYGESLGKELGRYDVYVSASRFDPGPNHIIEALSCGLPTYTHRDGGGAVEFAGMDAVYGNFDELLEKIRIKKEMKQSWTQTWELCAKEVFEVLDA